MSQTPVSTELAPAPAGPYSQAIVANGFLYTAGQTPHDPITGRTVGTTFEEQTIQTLTNLSAVLAGHNLNLSHVVKATVHLHHPGRDVAGFNATYQEFFVAPYPALTTVGSFLGDFLVEIDVVALSMTRVGMLPTPNAASARVMECPTANAVPTTPEVVLYI